MKKISRLLRSIQRIESLFEAEKEALQYLIQLKNQTNNPSKLNQVIDRYLNLIDFPEV